MYYGNQIKYGLRQQQGIATILLVVLIGIGLVGTALGVMYTLRGSQQQHVAAHAATHAQSGMWTGVEAFRRYIGGLSPADLQNLNGNAGFAIDLADADGDITAFGAIQVSDITVVAQEPGLSVSATISNVHAAAQAAASVQVVFQVNPLGNPSTIELPATLNFYDSVRLSGQVELDVAPNLNVKGDIDLSTGVYITGMDTLNATGNVSLDSGVTAQTIRANGNVTLDGSSSALTVRARGDVTTLQSASVGAVEANGNVSLGSSHHVATTRIDSLATITVEPWSSSHTLLRSRGPIVVDVGTNEYGQYLEYTQTVTTAQSLGLVDINSPHGTVSNITADTMDCPGTWDKYTTIQLKTGPMTGCTKVKLAAADPLNTAVVAPTTIEVEVMQEVQPYTLPPLVVDVFQLRSMANYQVEQVSDQTRVTVKDINGVDDGEYFLGNYDGNSSMKDFLCKVVSGANCVCQTRVSGVCQDPQLPLCISGGDTGCIDYAAGLFTFSGPTTAPGVMWIDGNVQLNSGFNNTTMLVTGNITSNGQYRGAAVNYGYEPPVYSMGTGNRGTRTTPYQEICQATGTGVANSLYNTFYSQRYPTNLCVNNAYVAIPVGNIALAAGGVRAGSSSFTGGDITIGSNSMVYGVTLAGGYLESGGQSVFFGQVAAAVQGTRRADDAVKNVVGENSKLLINSTTDFYSPSSVPEMVDPTNPNAGQNNAPNSSLIWSRYL